MLKQIGEIIKSGFGTTYKEMIESESWKKTIADIREGKTIGGAKGVPIHWVKKLVSKSEWNNYYSQLSTYCFLEKKDNGIMVGFCVANGIPHNCEICSDDDLWKIGEQRRLQNIYPNPLSEPIDKKETISEEKSESHQEFLESLPVEEKKQFHFAFGEKQDDVNCG